MNTDNKIIIGRNAHISFREGAADVPAKVDTGADSSSVWASDIHIDENGVLKFVLFGKNSPHYSGQLIERTEFWVAKVRSSSGHEQIRYQTHFSVNIKGKKIKALFNLSDRSNHNFPVLIGRRTLAGKFLVDVTLADIHEQNKRSTSKKYNEELEKDRFGFYKKYHQKGTNQ